jgi:hypothetical protein
MEAKRLDILHELAPAASLIAVTILHLHALVLTGNARFLLRVVGKESK